MEIKKATKKDLKKIAEIFQEYGKYEHNLDENVNCGKISEIIKIENKHMRDGTIYFLIIENEEIIGVINFNIDYRGKEKIGGIHTLIIIEKARGKGYGSKLFNFVLNYFKRKGCKRVRTFIHIKNKKAFDFWQKKKFIMEEGYIASRRII
jgi:GNAT superfamily N-acetyltransferase